MAVAVPQGYNNQAPAQSFSPSSGGSSSVSFGLGTGGGVGLGFSSGADVRNDQQQYNAPGQRNDGGFISDNSFQSGGNLGNYQAPSSNLRQSCGEGEVQQVDGTCARPIVNRRIFLYAAPPAQQVRTAPAGPLPQPKVDYNLVFVRTPGRTGDAKPIVIPPPKQKTLVYVLNENEGEIAQEIIEVPSNPTEPEVFYVNYDQGDNPELPGGIDLQEALARSAQQGEIIDAAEAAGARDAGGEYNGGQGGGIGGGFDGGISGGFGGGIGGVTGGGISGGSGGGFAGSSGSIRNDYSAPEQRQAQPQPPSSIYSSP